MIEIIAPTNLRLALMPTKWSWPLSCTTSAVQAMVTAAEVVGVMISQVEDFVGKI
jgi:negative regulator of sigma E activity